MLDARLTRTPITRVARLATGAALLTFTAALAAAQTGPVSFSGTVLDETGKPVFDATVALINAQTREVRGQDRQRRQRSIQRLCRHLRAPNNNGWFQEGGRHGQSGRQRR